MSERKLVERVDRVVGHLEYKDVTASLLAAGEAAEDETQGLQWCIEREVLANDIATGQEWELVDRLVILEYEAGRLCTERWALLGSADDEEYSACLDMVGCKLDDPATYDLFQAGLTIMEEQGRFL